MKPAEASLPSDTEVLVKRSFDAPVKLVWRAYMEPDLMRRWCCGHARLVDACLRDGYARRREVSLALAQRRERPGVRIHGRGSGGRVRTRKSCIRRSSMPDDLGVSMGGEPSIITVTFQETNGITNVATTIKICLEGGPRRGVRQPA